MAIEMREAESSIETRAASAVTRGARDAANWAHRVSTLEPSYVPAGAVNLNVSGRRPIGAIQGFGQLWQKTYSVRLDGISVDPHEVIRTWKANFGQFWPPEANFYGPITGIAPGEVALINQTLARGGARLSTGVMVLYADDESFTFMNPEGHLFAGWITFSAHRAEDGTTVAQIQVLIRASDPAWEVVLRLFAYKWEDRFWHRTLESLAKHFGVANPKAEMRSVVLDPKVQWSRFWNVRRNAAMWSGLYTLAAPFRWVAQPIQRAFGG